MNQSGPLWTKLAMQKREKMSLPASPLFRKLQKDGLTLKLGPIFEGEGMRELHSTCALATGLCIILRNV